MTSGQYSVLQPHSENMSINNRVLFLVPRIHNVLCPQVVKLIFFLGNVKIVESFTTLHPEYDSCLSGKAQIHGSRMAGCIHGW